MIIAKLRRRVNHIFCDSLAVHGTAGILPACVLFCCTKRSCIIEFTQRHINKGEFMKSMMLMLAVLFSYNAAYAQTTAGDPPQSYGQAVVSAVLRLDEHVTFYCDIQDFPSVVGKNMPVRLKSLKPAATPQENRKLLIFLNDLLFSKDKPVTSILLKDIERGKPFCLMANIVVDGKDLCDLLIEQNLARKVVEVGSAATTQNVVTASEASEQTAASGESQPITYVCSKSSKVYHRSTCSHAKRMDMSKALTFATSTEAAASGRRPCKTCNP